jgi:hypothetical protein
MMDTWLPSMNLRWFEEGDFTFPNYKKTLQQEWFDAWGNTEWRDVPLVKDE